MLIVKHIPLSFKYFKYLDFLNGSQWYLEVTDTCQVKGFLMVFLKAQFWFNSLKNSSINISTRCNTKRKQELSLLLRTSAGHS